MIPKYRVVSLIRSYHVEWGVRHDRADTSLCYCETRNAAKTIAAALNRRLREKKTEVQL